MTEPATTGWISVRTPPLADRPGRYRVQFGGERGTIRMVYWDGQQWRDDPHIKAVYGDRWSGLTKPAH